MVEGRLGDGEGHAAAGFAELEAGPVAPKLSARSLRHESEMGALQIGVRVAAAERGRIRGGDRR